MKFGVWLISLAVSIQAQAALDLEQFLNLVRERNTQFQGLAKSLDAAVERREAGDMALVPQFSLSGTKISDQKPLNMGGGLLMTDQNTTDISLGLGKTFSTGTYAQLTMGATQIDAAGAFASGGTTTPFTYTQAYSSMGINASQSLWKNFFGNATRLRWKRESLQEKSERSAIELQRRVLLNEAEAVFWEYLYMKEEMKLRKASLDRAQRILSWVQRRNQNGIGDRSDVLNAKALVATRELQLLSAKDEWEAIQKKVKDIIRSEPNEKMPELVGDLSAERALIRIANLGAKPVRPVKLDAYLAVLEAKMKSVSLDETLDSLRPDLVLRGSYKTNPTGADLQEATQNISQKTNPTTTVGISFNWSIDTDVKTSARNAAKLDALASALKMEQKLRESDTSWKEIQRRHEEMGRRVAAASIMSELQTQKAAVERDKLSKGRSITSQVITAEQDAAEAELTLTRMKAEHRKLESQARMYVEMEEQP